VHKRKI